MKSLTATEPMAIRQNRIKKQVVKIISQDVYSLQRRFRNGPPLFVSPGRGGGVRTENRGKRGAEMEPLHGFDGLPGRFAKKITNFLTRRIFCDTILSVPRGTVVSAPCRMSGCGAVGSALPWGGRGRWFKSSHSDENKAGYVLPCFHLNAWSCAGYDSALWSGVPG